MEATDGQPGGGEVAGEPPLPTLTVAAVARRLGVAPPTLRTWDRRYGLGPSAHTAGAHRRYSPSDVARLMVMRRLTLQGVPPADAARYALATQGAADDSSMASITPMGQGNTTETTPQRPEGHRTPPGGVSQSSVLDGGEGTDPEVEDVSDPFSDVDLSAARRADLADLDGDDLFEGDELLDGPWRDEPGSEIETPWLGVLRSAAQEGRAPDGRAPAGGGRVVALPYGSPATRGLARAAMSLDTLQTARQLRDAVR